MRIKNLHLNNFKRFTDLRITDIPESSKLVLLVGSNGSGKSSVFDAFDWLSKDNFKAMPRNGNGYYRKKSDIDSLLAIDFYDADKIEKGGKKRPVNIDLAKRFLGRSSVRIIPQITNSADPRQIDTDQDSPPSYIEHDTKFINDVFEYVNQIDTALREPVFEGRQADTLEIFKKSIDPLNQSLLKIFGDNKNTTIQIAKFSGATPREPAKLIFKKGLSEINYELLSHGEKQVIILLINFIVRQEFYKNSIIFIDEMDCHLNTSLQYSLIEEIVTKWIPNDSQLWTASHALGFIDYARKSNDASIIDFNLLNFDYPQELRPISKNELDIYEIAVPKEIIKDVLKDYKLVFVENKNDEFFNLAFLGADKNKFIFLGVNNSTEVFLSTKQDISKLGIRDRDYFRDDEINLIKSKLPNLKILNLYTFENYIYHPDNIFELGLSNFSRDDYKAEICRQKNTKLTEILLEIGESRQHYQELKEYTEKKDRENKIPIATALESDDFDTFYPVFNMKKHFSKSYLEKLNLTTPILVKTKWFKEEIEKVLTS